jgi:hypothetical protein
MAPAELNITCSGPNNGIFLFWNWPAQDSIFWDGSVTSLGDEGKIAAVLGSRKVHALR